MADIKINQQTGELAVPAENGGYRIYKSGEYKVDKANNRVAVPGNGGFVMYDMPAEKRPLFTAEGSKRALALGTRQSIEGLASPVTMAGDITNSLLNLPVQGANALFGTNIPTLPLPSRALNRTLVEDVGFPTEQSATENVFRAINTAGTGAMSGMGIGSAAATALNAPKAAAALTTHPGSQVVGGITGSVAAEGTRQGLQDTQIFENQTADAVAKSFLQLLAGVTGGTAGYLGSRGAVTAGKSIVGTTQGLTDLVTKKGQERIAGQVLREASGDPMSLQARLQDAQPSQIPGAQPTTAQALGGDSQLSSLELAMANDPTFRQAFDVRAAQNQQARTGLLNTMIPEGAGSVDDLATAIKQAWQQADDAGRQAILDAQQRAQQRITALGGTIDEQAAGNIIREELQTAYSRAKGQTSAAYQAIDPAGTSSLSGIAVYDRVAPLVERYFANSTSGTPDELLPILRRLRESPNMTLAQIDGVRQDLQTIAGKAQLAGDNRLSSVAGQMADDIGGYVDEAAASGQGFSPEQAQQYQAARDLRRAQGETFERGQVGAVLKRGPYGELKTPDSGVTAELFFRGSGSPEATQQFIQAAGTRPRAVTALRDHIATRLRQTVTNPDGTIDTNRLLRFQSEYGPALQSFPELRQGITNVAEAQALVDGATLAQATRQLEVSSSPLNNFLTKNPTDAVAAIVGSKNSEAAVTEIMRQFRNTPQAVDAFKRSVVEWFRSRIENAGVLPASGEQVQSYAKVKTILDDKLPTLRRIFSGEEINALRSFADQMATEARVMGAKPLGSNTFANIASRYLVERGMTGAAPMAATATKPIPSLGWIFRPIDESVKRNLVDALLNPSAAQRMVGLANPLPVGNLIEGLALLRRGAGAQTGLQAQQQIQQQNTSPNRQMFLPGGR